MKPRPRPPTIITRVIVFLLLGAIVNVAVAWGCAMWSYVPRLLVSPPADINPTYPPVRKPKTSEVRTIRHWQGAGVEYFDRITEEPFANILEVSAGVPMKSFFGEQIDNRFEFWAFRPPDLIVSNTPSSRPNRLLPFRPLWPGFAINTIFYGAILGLLFFAPGSVRRAFRRRRGLCPACAYPIGTSPVCTECGKPVTPKSVEPA